MSSVADFKDALLAAKLFSADRWQAFWDAIPEDQRPAEAEALADLLLKKELLTSFQAKKLLDGHGSELVLHDFVILDPTKADSKGAVFRARHRPTDAIVSLKVLGGRFKTGKALARIQSESRAVSLPHKNLRQIVAHGEHDGFLFLATEYFEGRDLRQELKARGQFSEELALDCAIQTARGLGHAHHRGQLHRNVQPCNLFLTDDGCVKVLNLGSSGADKDSNGVPVGMSLQEPDDDDAVGDVDYMSPEQAADWRQADARSDVYSLGCTLYRLLTTHRPYRGHNDADKIKAHREHPIPSLRGYRPAAPRALDAIVQKAMAKRPQDRYASMAEFADAMEKYLKQASGKSIEAADDPSNMMPAAVRTVRDTPPPEAMPPAHHTPPPMSAPPLPPMYAGSGYAASVPPPPYQQGGVMSAAALMPPPAAAGMPMNSAAMTSSAPASLLSTDEDDVQIGRRSRFNLGKTLGTLFVVGVTIALNVGVYYAFVVYGGPQYDYLNLIRPPTVQAPVDSKRAGMLQAAWARHLRIPFEENNSIGIEMVLVPPGDFLYGSPEDAADAQGAEKPQRRIQIVQPFYLSRHEVTQHQWRDLMGTSPWDGASNVQEGDTYPALNVSHDDALEFCRMLSEKENQTYRLPTEAEWEYACRAGTTTRFSFGDDDGGMAEFAWYSMPDKKSKSLAQSVGVKIGNAFSLHDMHGNVREWCHDWFAEDYYHNAPDQNPPGPEEGTLRVLRGGAWDQTSDLCRSAVREGKQPDRELVNAGFRVVRGYKKN